MLRVACRVPGFPVELKPHTLEAGKMRERYIFRYTLRISAAALLLAFSSLACIAQGTGSANQNGYGGPAQAETRKADKGPSKPAPVRDLNGTWRGPEEALLSNRIPAMTSAGQARLKQNIPDPFSATSNDPWKTCDPLGMPRAANNQIGIVGFAQMPGRIILLEGFRMWREIWMDGRELPKNVGHEGGYSTTYFGYSKGHWEGDHTLVIDTIGMDDSTWVDRRGYPHTVDARVVERYTRTDFDHLDFTETVDDPAYYTQPFLLAKGTMTWIRSQEDSSVPTIPFAEEHLCIPSTAIEYMKLLALPVDEDAVTGDKPNANSNKK